MQKMKKPITSPYDFHNWTNDEKLKNSDYFVECTRFEFDFIYKKSENESLEWIKDTCGFDRHIGFIGNRLRMRMVRIDFSFCAIGGKYICFYYSCSRFCDWDLVDKFIEKHAPIHDGRIAKSEASKFYDVLNFCKSKK